MLLVLFGPSCSGKSTIARFIGERTGASVWTGRDYLRLAKNEGQAWRRFLDLLNAAAAAGRLWEDSIIYVAADAGITSRILESVPGTIPIRLHADLPTLESRFAPRVGGTVSPAIAAMLKRSLEATVGLPAFISCDTTQSSCEKTAEKIIERCERRSDDSQ